MARQRSGSIINLTSISGFRGNTGQTNYSASKAAIIGMTHTLAREMGRRKIRVNAVAPGLVDTPMLDTNLKGKNKSSIEEGIPLRRMARPEEIAEPILFLASEAASYITGEILEVNGWALMD